MRDPGKVAAGHPVRWSLARLPRPPGGAWRAQIWAESLDAAAGRSSALTGSPGWACGGGRVAVPVRWRLGARGLDLGPRGPAAARRGGSSVDGLVEGGSSLPAIWRPGDPCAAVLRPGARAASVGASDVAGRDLAAPPSVLGVGWRPARGPSVATQRRWLAGFGRFRSGPARWRSVQRRGLMAASTWSWRVVME